MANKYLSSDGLLYYNQKINAELSKKVDKVEGKGLSTNDLTDELKQKILDAGSSSFNGSYDALTSKPSINGHELKGGTNTLETLGIQASESGKGLSSNDYTTADKDKLSDIASGAQVNVIETIKVNGTAQPITSKAVDITIPTNNNQLTNGAGYQTSSEVNSAISSAIAGVTQFDYKIVASLPTAGVKGTIYLVANGGTDNNIYDEYIYITNSWEKFGTTEVDLSGYIKTSDLSAITNEEIDTIVAG